MKKLLDDIKSARWAIILIIAYFVYLKKYIYTLCPVVLLTGFPCPGCGMTRAMFRVLRFDFAGAWEMHAFIYPIGILAIIFCINRYILNGKWTKVIKFCVFITATGMLLFYVYRMVKMFPNVTPMIYYKNNFIHKIMCMFL